MRWVVYIIVETGDLFLYCPKLNKIMFTEDIEGVDADNRANWNVEHLGEL